MTPLSLACDRGLTEVAMELLKSSEEGGPALGKGFINIEDSGNGITAIPHAIGEHMLEVMKLLLDRGAEWYIFSSQLDI